MLSPYQLDFFPFSSLLQNHDHHHTMSSRIIAFLALAATSCATDHYPDMNAARQNAFALFNSIHSAMRQWGSSINHNGMSFYLAQAPEGSIFYHGSFLDTRPTTPEWLAFEVEHAANFAQSWEGRPIPNPNTMSPEPYTAANIDNVLFWHRALRSQAVREITDPDYLLDPSESAQRRLSGHTQEEDDGGNGTMPGGPPGPGDTFRGYFHTYRANRPLNLVYIDGEGAAKCPLGSLDSQDLILLGWNYTENTQRKQMLAEFQRAREMCDLANKWLPSGGGKIDGFIRMEAGFEIIYCDFSRAGGLDLLSVEASSFRNESHIDDGETGFPALYSIRMFEWLRAAAARFHGHPVGRLTLDWSSMVSAFSYPVSLANPDPTRQDLPRLLAATDDERKGIRARLREVIIQRGGIPVNKKKTIDWQSTVDSIVTRYSQRLEYVMNQNLTANRMLAVIGTLVDPFVDYLDHTPAAEHSAIRRCTLHYLQSSSLQRDSWTPEDHAIFAAIETVSRNICDSVFRARRRLIDSVSMANDWPSIQDAQETIRSLTTKLKWSTWRECSSCASHEICSIPMFPIGAVDDYFHPSCKSLSQLTIGYFVKWS